jgi:hypothetical protein
MSFTIGFKLSTTNSDGKEFTSAPTYVEATSATSMIDTSKCIVQALIILENVGAIDGYDVVLKCKPEPAAPGAGP